MKTAEDLARQLAPAIRNFITELKFQQIMSSR